MTRAIGAAVAGVLSALAVSLVAAQDFTSLPLAPADVEKQIHDVKVGVAQAVDIAQKELKGLARSATLSLANPPSVSVDLYAEGKHWTVVVDGTSGAITSKTEIPRLPGEPVTGEPRTTNSGLMFYDIKVGEGPAPSGANAQVTVHYTGWLSDGMKFDSSVDRGAPATFPLGGVIAGWTEGVGSMKVGGKRKLLIPYKLGYGEGGNPRGRIPPRALLIFDVELIRITEPGQADPNAARTDH